MTSNQELLDLESNANNDHHSQIYAPLDPDRRETRFVTVAPSRDFNARIDCTVSAASLDDCPEYIALSYVWGNPKIVPTILLNGFEQKVTINLGAALRRLRASEHQCFPIWIDAIYINQANVIERNSQMHIISGVYGEAELVIAWLGEEKDDSDLAMGILELLGDFYGKHIRGRDELSGDQLRCILDKANRTIDIFQD